MFIKELILSNIMATLKRKDYVRKLRKGAGEIYISLSFKFLEENNLKVGDYIDLRNLKKVSQKDSD